MIFKEASIYEEDEVIIISIGNYRIISRDDSNKMTLYKNQREIGVFRSLHDCCKEIIRIHSGVNDIEA